MSKLTNTLQQLSSSISAAQSSESVYYTIGHTVVRVSEHFSDNSKCDLAVFQVNARYVVVPMIGLNKRIQLFTNVDQVVNFIQSFDSISSILSRTPAQYKQEHIFDESNILNDLKANWSAPTKYPDLYSLALQKYHDCKTLTQKIAFYNKIRLYNGRPAAIKYSFLQRL